MLFFLYQAAENGRIDFFMLVKLVASYAAEKWERVEVQVLFLEDDITGSLIAGAWRRVSP